MNIINHGTWEIYKPEEPPEGAPAGAMFARRNGDNRDWYDYVNGEHFDPAAIKMTVTNGTVSAATADPTALFPAGSTVLEVGGAPAGDPQKAFGRKIYNADKKTFDDPPPHDYGPSIPDLLKRIEDLEKRGT